MTLPINGTAIIGGLPLDNALVSAYKASRFVSDPTLNDAPPDSPAWSAPDAGPVTSGGAYGGSGAYTLQVPDSGNYWIGAYQAGNPTAIAWERKSTVTHTSQQGWNAFKNVGSSRSLASTVGAGGTQTLPTSTLTVGSTTGFLTASTLIVWTNGGASQLVRYTGKTSTTFTGCTGGTGTVSNGNKVIQGYQNDAYRRLVIATVDMESTGSGASLTVQAQTRYASDPAYNGVPTAIQSASLTQNGTQNETVTFPITFPVDPNELYALEGLVNSTPGSVNKISWFEVDF